MNASQFKIKSRISLAVLKIRPNGGPRYFKFLKPMFKGRKLDDQKDAATLIESIDLVSGEHGVIIPPTILQKDLAEAFPGDSYVGRCFEVVVTRDTAKKYNHVALAEIDDPQDAAQAQAAAAAAANSEVEVSAEELAKASAEAAEHADASDTPDAPTAGAPAQGGRRRR